MVEYALFCYIISSFVCEQGSQLSFLGEEGEEEPQ